jgi:hypothetical protein
MKFSEEEIKSFRAQYQKEYTGMLETEGELRSIQEKEAEPDAEETSQEEPASKEAMVARTKRMLDRERRIVEGIQREISSEERDKLYFTKELQQIMAELEGDEEG